MDHLCDFHRLVEPDRTPRAQAGEPSWSPPPDAEARLGRFRDPERDRKCVTDDMDIIRFYQNGLKEEPPSFVEAGPRQKLYYDPANACVATATSCSSSSPR